MQRLLAIILAVVLSTQALAEEKTVAIDLAAQLSELIAGPEHRAVIKGYGQAEDISDRLRVEFEVRVHRPSHVEALEYTQAVVKIIEEWIDEAGFDDMKKSLVSFSMDRNSAVSAFGNQKQPSENNKTQPQNYVNVYQELILEFDREHVPAVAMLLDKVYTMDEPGVTVSHSQFHYINITREMNYHHARENAWEQIHQKRKMIEEELDVELVPIRVVDNNKDTRQTISRDGRIRTYAHIEVEYYIEHLDDDDDDDDD